jgi:hypothetical protein
LQEKNLKTKIIVKSIRLHPFFLKQIESECRHQQVDFSAFLRKATLGALRTTASNNPQANIQGELPMESSNTVIQKDKSYDTDTNESGAFNFLTAALYKDETTAARTKELMNFADQILSIEDRSVFTLAVFFDS